MLTTAEEPFNAVSVPIQRIAEDLAVLWHQVVNWQHRSALVAHWVPVPSAQARLDQNCAKEKTYVIRARQHPSNLREVKAKVITAACAGKREPSCRKVGLKNIYC